MQLARSSEQTTDAVAGVAAALVLGTAMVFGGGPRGVGDMAVHLAVVPALVLGIVRWRHHAVSREQRWLLYWLLAATALMLLQLLPLPAALIACLPQRAGVLADLKAAGVDRAWLPMTLDAWATVRGLLALLSFGAIWLLASTLPFAHRLRLVQLAIAIAVMIALVGFAQAASAGHSALRPYDFHHPIGAIGTFANRNHFACLMAMLSPLALVFAVRVQRAGQLASVGWYAAALILLLASALSYSRAGFALTLAALAITVIVLAWRGRSMQSRARAAMVPVLVTMIAAAAVGYYAWDGLMQRIAQDPLTDLRWQYLRYGWDAAQHYLPWGSGLGSFPWAYASLEPVSAMTSVYAERAHNDVLQVLIETGVPGIVLVLLMLALVFAMVRKIPMGVTQRVSDHSVRTVTLVAVSAPLLHSLVDYPLRTLAVASVFALLLTVIPGVSQAGGDGAS